LTKSSSEQHEQKLRALMVKHNLQAKGNFLTAAYNPPWALPFMRRNEVWLAVEQSSQDENK
jgi:hypothetical protein